MTGTEASVHAWLSAPWHWAIVVVAVIILVTLLICLIAAACSSGSSRSAAITRENDAARQTSDQIARLHQAASAEIRRLAEDHRRGIR